MEPLYLLQAIRDFLKKNKEADLTSPMCYDTDKLEKKVSFYIMGENKEGQRYKKGQITVESFE